MINQAQAEHLISLPKQIVEDKEMLEKMDYIPRFPLKERFHLVSSEDEINFFWEIYQSAKNQLKLSLHAQDKDSETGLLRVDFGGKHMNPTGITDNLPDIFRQFAGREINESHVHYFIEGYKPLTWAIPLTNDNRFPVTVFENSTNIIDILLSFKDAINIVTPINVIVQTRIL